MKAHYYPVRLLAKWYRPLWYINTSIGVFGGRGNDEREAFNRILGDNRRLGNKYPITMLEGHSMVSKCTGIEWDVYK